ncbi:MAG TPA: transglycosylase SLT domain-containing protein [Pyrinomonadaceae bacterium]|jgi:membrane-bound lytic murein transglycosylase D
MTTSFPRLLTRVALLATIFIPTAIIQAQIPAGSSARSIPTEVERTEKRVQEVIKRAETSFNEGELHLKANEREQARVKFDKAVDTILESGLDVRASQTLQNYYYELVERIYRIEVPTQQQFAPQPIQTALVAQNPQLPSSGTGRIKTDDVAPQIGFREQKFEPSPRDELAKFTFKPEEEIVNPADIAALEAAKNSVDFKFNINPLVQQFINYYQGRGRATMETGMRRSGQFMRMARKIFREEGVPEDITWLGQVESAWRAKAFSTAAASGLWQFVPSTGRQYGLRQTAWVDERNSFEKATRASARYLKWLANRYNGNWELAIAAYNTGEGNIDRAISRAGSANFWTIYPYIAQETRNYVPNILATILITKNPEKYGFRGIRPDAPMSYDIVRVPTATSLQLIADATDTSVDYLRSLNPELRRDVTPRGEAYDVRVPGGRSKQLVAVLKRIPVDRRETARVISVAPGEALEQVAQRTGTSVEMLRAMNAGVDANNAGGKVVVPKNNVALTSWRRSKPADETASGRKVVRASAGDTAAKIASRYNVSAVEVAQLNGIAVDDQLQAGREIRLPASASTPAPSRRRSR